MYVLYYAQSTNNSYIHILSFIASNFFHFDFFHILWNIYFFRLFGYQIEEMLGKKQFLLFILGSSLASSLFFYLAHFYSIVFIPSIGISGVVSAMFASLSLSKKEINIKYFFWGKERPFPLAHFLPFFA
ncbi:MAG: rhomboid family intramembrane serine protease [Bacteriovoracaceae bacterium]|nr:rhomboid family intramembrane serine protease [Bacteriovoracaceae bacterium]